ncbi:hypothetical protein J2X69_003007 [Algoriphagus sp. 4150]|nr:hypothetical protein [Algoriphagus sp. 4150]
MKQHLAIVSYFSVGAYDSTSAEENQMLSEIH